jgi:hypothetical protein
MNQVTRDTARCDVSVRHKILHFHIKTNKINTTLMLHIYQQLACREVNNIINFRINVFLTPARTKSDYFKSSINRMFLVTGNIVLSLPYVHRTFLLLHSYQIIYTVIFSRL